eukprot:979788-Rhodomonas_salina.2
MSASDTVGSALPSWRSNTTAGFRPSSRLTSGSYSSSGTRTRSVSSAHGRQAENNCKNPSL